MRLFDTVLITASSERQAGAFRALLERRREQGLYPRELAFEVVPDPPAGRVGTGGSTLWALHRLLETRGGDAGAFLGSQRILLIHAGGESRRLPCYAPEGKLFSPLPIASSALLPPVVLDVQLGLFFKYPWRRGEIVVSSGDAVIDFDPTCVPEERSAVFGFAKPASLEQGSRHGVFRFDQRRERVLDYFQKAPAEVLAREALIEGTSDCALDIGLVSLAPRAAHAFLELGRTRTAGGTLLEALASGRLRFDLYLEVLTACLASLSFEAFWERVEGASALPRELARAVYEAFHPFGLGGVVTRSTVFEHVGSLAELPEASRGLLTHRVAPFYERDGGEIRPFEAPDRIVHNSVGVDVTVAGGAPVLVEGCSSCSLGGPRRGQPGRRPRGPRPSLRPAARLHARRAAPARGSRRRDPLRERQPEARDRPRPPRLLRQAPRRVAGGARARPGRRVRRRRRQGPLRRPPVLPRPHARAPGGLPPPARRGVDAGLPRRAPAVHRRDQRPGRRRAAGGPAGRPAPRAAARALPAGPGLVRDERARLRGRLRGRRVALAAAGVARAHRRRPAARLPREALPRRLPRGRRPGLGGPGDRLRGARGGAGAPAHGAQGGPDRLGARPGEVRPRRRLDRHAALHAARGRPGREPRGGPQRAAADPGLLPPHGRAPRARPLDRPRPHRDVHALRGAARLPGPRLPLRAAEGGPVPHGPRRRAGRGAGRCRRSSTGSGRASRSRSCARCRRDPGSARPRSSAG